MQETKDFKTPKFETDSVLSLVFTIMRKHVVLFCALVAVVSIPSSIIDVYAEGNTARYISMGLFLLLGAIAEIIICYAVYLSLIGREVTLAECWAQTHKQLPNACCATIAAAVLSAIGIAFFIIPGVYLIVVLAFSVQACVMERLNAVAALKRSIELVKGHFGNIFAIILIVNIVSTGLAVCLEGATEFISGGNPAIEFLGSVLSSLPIVLIYVTMAVVYFKLLYIKATGAHEIRARLIIN